MSIPNWMKNRNVHAVLIMVLVLILLVATEGQIGLTWDEPDYIIASEAYNAWFGDVVADPGGALSTAGIEESWSVNHEHPPLDKIYSGFVWAAARHVFDDLTAHRMGNMILAAVTAGLLYLLLAESFSWAAGLAAVAALLTLPRFFFHAHLAALDVPAACAIFIVTFLFWKTKDDPSRKWTVVLGLAWGLAFATKINAVFLPPALFLWALLFRREGRMFERIILMGIIGVLFSFAVWPWLYPEFPARALDYLAWITTEHWKIGQWYLGQMYMPPPWHLPFVITWAVVPLTLTALYWIGIVRALVKRFEADGLGILLIINAVVPLLALTTGGSMVYDNDRLFMPAFPFLAALAGAGFGWILTGIRRAAERVQQPRLAAPAGVLAALLFFLPQTLSLVRLYPHLLSYYSETVGGLPGATRMGLETTYWCETYASAIPFLNENAGPGDMVWVDPWSHNVMIYYQVHGLLRDDIQIAFPPFSPPSFFSEYGPQTFADPEQSNWIVVQYRQTTIGSTPEYPGRDSYIPHPDSEWLAGHEPEFRLEYDGLPIMEIYANEPPVPEEPEPGGGDGEEEADPLAYTVEDGLFTAETGNFTLQVPPGLEFSATSFPVAGAGLTVHRFSGLGEGSVQYNIVYFDYPGGSSSDPDAAKGILTGMRDGWLGEIQGTLVEDHPISLGEYPGMEGIAETDIEGRPMKIKYVHYMVGSRCYQISVWIPKDGEFTEEMEAFLDSFAVLVEAQ
jgi:4-amino-4-deoxy-L-arabinose transferase-like glycosyltransferase